MDRWVEDHSACDDATALFNEMLPKHAEKLRRLDKRIAKILAEIQEVFPDAQYYTASGGFMLVLGSTHDDADLSAQQQRSAWFGIHASISDGDW